MEAKIPPRLLFLSYLALDLPVFLYLSLLHWENVLRAPRLANAIPTGWLSVTTVVIAGLVLNLSNTKKHLNYTWIAMVYIYVLKSFTFWFLSCCGLSWNHSFFFENLYQVLSGVWLKLPYDKLLEGSIASSISFAALRAYSHNYSVASASFWILVTSYSLFLFASSYTIACSLTYAVEREDFGGRAKPIRPLRRSQLGLLPQYKRWLKQLGQQIYETAATLEPLLILAAVCLPLIVYPVMLLLHKTATQGADSSAVFPVLTALGCSFIMGAVERRSLAVVLFKQLAASLAVLDDLLPGHVAARMLEKASARSYAYGVQYSEALQLLSHTVEQLRLQRMLGLRPPPVRRRSYAGATALRRRASTSGAASMAASGSRRSSMGSEASEQSASEPLCEEELLLLDLLASGKLQQWLRQPDKAPWLYDTDSPRRVDSPRRRYSVRMREGLVSKAGQPSAAVQRLIDSDHRSNSRRSSTKSVYSDMAPIEEVRESSGGHTTPERGQSGQLMPLEVQQVEDAQELPEDAQQLQLQVASGTVTPSSHSGGWHTPSGGYNLARFNLDSETDGTPTPATSPLSPSPAAALPTRTRRRRSSSGVHSELLQRLLAERANQLVTEVVEPGDELLPTFDVNVSPALAAQPRRARRARRASVSSGAVQDASNQDDVNSFSSEFSVPSALVSRSVSGQSLQNAAAKVVEQEQTAEQQQLQQQSASDLKDQALPSQAQTLSALSEGSVTSSLVLPHAAAPASPSPTLLTAGSTLLHTSEGRRGSTGSASSGVKVHRTTKVRGSRRLSYAEWHDNVTILFADIVGFTAMSTQAAPQQVMHMLNELYSRFDCLCMEMGVYKVETVGDCYMAATNLVTRDRDHVATMLNFALRMQKEAAQVVSPTGAPLQLRIGMHSGRVMSGVVGRIRRRYCLFGDTVNTASRMESSSAPGQVQVSPQAHELLKSRAEFRWLPPRQVQIKGKGTMTTYMLDMQRTRL